MTKTHAAAPGRAVLAVLLVCAALAGACSSGGSNGSSSNGSNSPTSPSSSGSVSLTGTWFAEGASYMTLTQSGSTITGTLTPTSTPSSGFTLSTAGTVAGTLSGSAVNLTIPNTLKETGSGGPVFSCTATDTFVGQATGTSMTGTYVFGVVTCDNGIGLLTPAFTVARTMSKQ